MQRQVKDDFCEEIDAAVSRSLKISMMCAIIAAVTASLIMYHYAPNNDFILSSFVPNISFSEGSFRIINQTESFSDDFYDINAECESINGNSINMALHIYNRSGKAFSLSSHDLNVYAVDPNDSANLIKCEYSFVTKSNVMDCQNSDIVFCVHRPTELSAEEKCMLIRLYLPKSEIILEIVCNLPV